MEIMGTYSRWKDDDDWLMNDDRSTQDFFFTYMEEDNGLGKVKVQLSVYGSFGRWKIWRVFLTVGLAGFYKTNFKFLELYIQPFPQQSLVIETETRLTTISIAIPPRT